MIPKPPIAIAVRLSWLACFLLIAALGWAPPPGVAAESKPVLVGYDYAVASGAASNAIKYGLEMAIDEINAGGGVLGGRKIQMVITDNHANPSRGKANMRAFGEMPDMVAVMGGGYSTVLLESLDTAHDAKLNLLLPWTSADALIANGKEPNYAFRIGIYDDLCAHAMLAYARERNLKRIGLLITNNGWGRSNLAALERHLKGMPDMKVVATEWHNVGATMMIDKYNKLRDAGAQVVVLLSGREFAVLLREIGERPGETILPFVSHGGGVVGWELFKDNGPTLMRIDLAVVQSFSLFRIDPAKAAAMVAKVREAYGIDLYKDFDGPVGFANAYDLMHILARAITLAGSTDRAKVRDALEQVRDYDGLMRRYERPFEPGRHEAAGMAQIVLTRFRADGVLVPVDTRPD
ncbi:MAG: ABC transporter substrate-binding protein [Candidatus Competibacteraceae bacterium]